MRSFVQVIFAPRLMAKREAPSCLSRKRIVTFYVEFTYAFVTDNAVAISRQSKLDRIL